MFQLRQDWTPGERLPIELSTESPPSDPKQPGKRTGATASMVKARASAQHHPLMFHLNSISPSSLTVIISLNSLTTAAIVDTGAAVSVVHPCFINAQQLQPCDILIRAVNGDTIPVKGTAMVTVGVGQQQIQTPS